MKELIALLIFTLTLGASALAADAGNKDDLRLQRIRNASLKLSSGDTTFLIDPMFAEVGAYEGFPDTYRSWLRNSLTPLCPCLWRKLSATSTP